MDAGCRRMLEDVSGDAGGGWLVASGHNGPEGGEIRQPHGACLEEVRGMGHKAPLSLGPRRGPTTRPMSYNRLVVNVLCAEALSFVFFHLKSLLN